MDCSHTKVKTCLKCYDEERFLDHNAEIRQHLAIEDGLQRQRDAARAALESMLAMYPASTFCEVDCEKGSCEHCQLEAKVKEAISL